MRNQSLFYIPYHSKTYLISSNCVILIIITNLFYCGSPKCTDYALEYEYFPRIDDLSVDNRLPTA